MRRLLFLHTLLKRDNNELTKQIYSAQKENPLPGDFCEIVSADLKLIGLTEENVMQMSKSAFKRKVKAAIVKEALESLKQIQQTHTKVNKLKYSKLQAQSYFKSPLFSNTEAKLLFKIRTEFTDCKINFKHMNREGSMKCPLCKEYEDDQKHIIECTYIRNNISSNDILERNIAYEDIYSDNDHKKKAITVVFDQCLKIREKLMNNLPKEQNLSILMNAGG